MLGIGSLIGAGVGLAANSMWGDSKNNAMALMGGAALGGLAGYGYNSGLFSLGAGQAATATGAEGMSMAGGFDANAILQGSADNFTPAFTQGAGAIPTAGGASMFSQLGGYKGVTSLMEAGGGLYTGIKNVQNTEKMFDTYKSELKKEDERKQALSGYTFGGM